MKKIIISADRTCDMTDEMLERYGVKTIPYHIISEGKEYLDNIDITPEILFEKFYEKKELPKTSAVNEFEYSEFFRSLKTENNEIIHFTLGGGLSVSAKNAKTAADKIDGVYSIDSFNLSTGTALLVIKAAELAEAGMPAVEIVEKIEAMRGNVHSSFIIDTLKFLHAGGRCSALSKISAAMLNIKPCINVDNTSGGMTVGKKYRGNLKKVLDKYVEDKLSEYDSYDLDRVFVTYSSLDDEIIAEKVKEKVLSIVPFKEVFITRASSTISSHCGPNTLGILFMTK